MLLTTGTWLFGGCSDTPVSPLDAGDAPLQIAGETDAEGQLEKAAAQQTRQKRWLRQLRRATAKYRRIQVAAELGYDAQLTPCQEVEVGGMGFHFGNLALFDDKVEALKPEVLLYEPQKDGRLRLVAVEYAVPFTVWHEADPPELNGVAFHRNNTFGLWILHAWVWKHNPEGVLEDWNPRVSCRYAEASDA